MIRDFASTAHVHAAHEMLPASPGWRRLPPIKQGWLASGQATLPTRRYSPLAHAYNTGFGDVA